MRDMNISEDDINGKSLLVVHVGKIVVQLLESSVDKIPVLS